MKTAKSIRVFGKLYRIVTIKKAFVELNLGTALWKVADKYTNGNHAHLNAAFKLL